MELISIFSFYVLIQKWKNRTFNEIDFSILFVPLLIKNRKIENARKCIPFLCFYQLDQKTENCKLYKNIVYTHKQYFPDF